MNQIILHTGSNFGNRIHHLQTANFWIKKLIGPIQVLSNYYETAAWGKTNQPPFLNQALIVKTNLSPQNLLKTVLEIEQKIGRIRLEKWGQRLIDIDILFYENEIIDLPDLKIPHPLLQERNFVLVPLVEIAKNWTHPIFKMSFQSLLEKSKDGLEVKVYLG